MQVWTCCFLLCQFGRRAEASFIHHHSFIPRSSHNFRSTFSSNVATTMTTASKIDGDDGHHVRGVGGRGGFNGGKMNHIFKPNRGFYDEEFACDDAKRCFENPNNPFVSLKVHGECCLLFKKPAINDEEGDGTSGAAGAADIEGDDKCRYYEWIFATRHDTHGRPPPEGAIPIPEGIQPAEFEKHTYCFIPLEKDKVVGKGSKKSFVGKETYQAIANGVRDGQIPDPNSSEAPDFVSVEWLGRKHQGNIDNIDADHALYVHGSTLLPAEQIPRTREAAEKMARELSIEGLVYYDEKTGERFKLRFDMLPDSLFKKKCKETITSETTAIKPKVIFPDMTTSTES